MDDLSAFKAKDRLLSALSQESSRGVMPKVSVTEKDGTIKEWRLIEKNCPKCNNISTGKIAITPDTTTFNICYSCGYQER